MLAGEGAFSFVYRVRQTSLDRWVAMKIITEHDRTRRDELRREAQTQASIHLDCIPQIYDAFEWKKRLCIVMQWLKGVSLREILDNSPSLSSRFYVADFLIRTIAALHEQGFAHHDLKPENIFICPAKGMYLVDFGFTKNINDRSSSTVSQEIIKGTPAYMAPELWNTDKTSNPLRSDLYALGKILKEMFPSGSTLHETINTLLEDNPDKRPESARVFYSLWEHIAPPMSGAAGWEQIAGTLTRTRHSRKLLSASRELLHANRSDESYWLLAECIDEDPDYIEAVDFMSKFPKSLRMKTKKILYGTLAIVSLLIIILSFFAGKLSQQNVVIVADRALSELKQDSTRAIRISGYIFITGIPPGCILSIDNKVISHNTAARGIELPCGFHLLSCKNSAGQTIWENQCMLFPFQKKYFSIQMQG